MVIWVAFFDAVLKPHVWLPPPCFQVYGLRFFLSGTDVSCLWTTLAPIRLFCSLDRTVSLNPKPWTWSFFCRINLKLDGWAWSLLLSPPSLSHFYFSFSWLFHFDAVLYMWLHCRPPTSAVQLMRRYCGASSFCIHNRADCSNCSKHFLPTGIKTFFFSCFVHYVP